jgi:cobalt/nickel transport system permease protein
MADALLSPTMGATFWAGSLGMITWCAKKLKDNINDRMVPLMGVLGAFIFAAQMINFTIPGTGSSGHLGGGLLLAIILGPYAGFIVMASVLIIQALFFADGGLLALGCNIWNMGFYTCFIAYPLIYKPLVQRGDSSKRITVASMIGAVVSLQLGAFSVVLQTLLSGRSELPFSTFILFMQPIHLAIGIVEGFITAGVVNFVRATRPDIIGVTVSSQPISSNLSIRRLFAGFLMVALLTGGVFSWFASSNPDGLEWSIERVSGDSELPQKENRLGFLLKRLQDKIAFLPDYGFKQKKRLTGHNLPAEVSTSLSGVLGSIMVLCLVVLLGFGIRAFKRRVS